MSTTRCAIGGCDRAVYVRGLCRPHHEPGRCLTCGRQLGQGPQTGYHPRCEPTTCTCADPRPDPIGECGRCRRLVLSHSWHHGRPAAAGSVLSPAAATGDVDRRAAGATS